MLEGLFAAGGVLHGDEEQTAAVVGLLDGDGDGPGAAVFEEGAQGLFGVLAGQDAHAGHVLLAGQLVQARAYGRVRPPRTQRRGEANIDGVA